MTAPEDVTYARKVAEGLLPVASIVSLPLFHCAFVIEAVSETGLGWIESVADLETVRYTALMLANVVVVTGRVVIVKVALFAPAGTTTEAGTLAEADADESCTVIPPEGAAGVRVTTVPGRNA